MRLHLMIELDIVWCCVVYRDVVDWSGGGVQCSIVQCSVVQYSVVQYSVMQCSVMQCSEVRHSVV